MLTTEQKKILRLKIAQQSADRIPEYMEQLADDNSFALTEIANFVLEQQNQLVAKREALEAQLQAVNDQITLIENN